MNPPAHFSAFPEQGQGASRATSKHAATFSPCAPSSRRGRKPVVTPERLADVCARLASGETERAACLAAGLGLTSWNLAKRREAALRSRIAAARAEWAQQRHRRHLAALSASQSARAAGRKARKPQPIYQAKLVLWHLVTRVPLSHVAISEGELAVALERFNLSRDTWDRQSAAFGLLAQVYKRRAEIRGRVARAPVQTAMQFTPLASFGGYSDSDQDLDDFRSRYTP